MDNQELVQKIQSLAEEKDHGESGSAAGSIKFLVFAIGDKRYAVYAHEVREIVTDATLFYVPFVPPYVRGFINRHGEPYTVIDPEVLLDKTKQESSTFLILKVAHDSLAYMITEVQEITGLPKSEVHMISAVEEEEESLYLGSIALGGREIFILSLAGITAKLDADLAS